MTPSQIEAKYKSLLRRRIKLDADFDKLRSDIKDICHHPPEHIHRWTDHRDNGYGKWWEVEMRTCLICGKRL